MNCGVDLNQTIYLFKAGGGSVLDHVPPDLNDIHKMFKVLKTINPDIRFPEIIKKSYYLFGRKLK